LSLFFYLIFIWLWAFKGYNTTLDFLDSPSSLYYIIIRLLLIYFAIEILTPDEPVNGDFKTHFRKVSQKFYVLMILLWSYELLLYPLAGHINLSLRLQLYLVNLPIAIALYFVRNVKFQTAMAVVFLGLEVVANLLVLEFL